MKSLRSQLEEMLATINEKAPVIASFAKKSGKSEKDVEDMWNKIKKSLIGQGHKESDDNFFALLTGSLKNSLKIK